MAGGWGNLQHWNTQAAQPAAPAGQRQMAQAAAQNARRQSDWSNLGTWTNEKGYVGAAQSWYTGANKTTPRTGGTPTSWDYMAQDAARAKRARAWSSRPGRGNGCGHPSRDNPRRKKFEFGDIYDGGQYAGNVFEQFDKDTADLMMADLLFDAGREGGYYTESKARGTERRGRGLRSTRRREARTSGELGAASDQGGDQVRGLTKSVPRSSGGERSTRPSRVARRWSAHGGGAGAVGGAAFGAVVGPGSRRPDRWSASVSRSVASAPSSTGMR